MVKVSIISTKDHYQGVFQALELVKDEIRQKIAGKKRIVIKPNLCVCGNFLAATNVDAVRACLDFLSKELNVSQNIVIAEAPFDGGVEKHLEFYGYNKKLADYPVKFVNLNNDKYKSFEIFWKRGKSVKINFAKTVLDSDFLISICPAKTHDSVITTLSIKNVVVGSMIVPPFPIRLNKYVNFEFPDYMSGNHARINIHGSPYKINRIISSVAKYVWPDLAIIDGVVGMEGDGPVSHEGIDFGLVFVSLDPLAADSICSHLMGFDPKTIGYYHYIDKMGLGTNNLSKIQVLGIKDPQAHKKMFKPHRTYQEQLQWRKERKIKDFYVFLRYKSFGYFKREIKKFLKIK